jgi:glyoxylase-like metal-dependent hydrolase (beta-lactamase superfamily II)
MDEDAASDNSFSTRRDDAMRTAETFPFTIGEFTCCAVSDGTFTYTPPLFPPPPTLLFANAPPEQLTQALKAHGLQPPPWTAWISPYICLLIETGEQTVLVDTGAGCLGPHTGRLPANLQALGVAPTDIDMVILTHGHPDHIGGTVDREGRLAFPNARYVMWRDEWAFWASDLTAWTREEPARETLWKVAQAQLPPLRDRLQLVDQEVEVLPGVVAVAAPGHTPGHMGLRVSSHGEHLLCIADTALHPLHVAQPTWHAVVDGSPEQVARTRRRLFTQAKDEEALVLAFHFPFPGVGHIVQGTTGLQWQPI